MGIVPFVQRHQDHGRVSQGDIRHRYEFQDLFAGRYHLFRAAIQVRHNAAGAAQRVSENIERGGAKSGR